MSKSKGIRAFGLILLLACLFGSYLVTNVPEQWGEDHVLAKLSQADAIWQYTAVVVLLLAGVILGAMLLMGNLGKGEGMADRPRSKVLGKRSKVSALFVLILIPITILIGAFVLEDRKYYLISILVILEALLPFFIAFERRKPQAKELVVLAVICGLAVASRIAFAFLPQFKPVAALVIVAGIAFGGEAGFLVGAMSAFLSNFYLMQGPWTPWQMFAFGVIGFLAGVLFQKGLLPKKRVAMAAFGGLATVILYGGIVDIHSMFMFYPEPSLSLLLTTYALGIPYTLIHGAATVVFLWLIGPALLERLERVKLKYGLGPKS